MRLILILTLAVVIASCEDRKHFSMFADSEDVTLVLSGFGLDSIPPEIGELKKVQNLSVSLDTAGDWSVYPPLSMLERAVDEPPFAVLPDEITELKNLKRLILMGLNIKTLPKNFDKLENLEYLDLSMNKLTVANELQKLNGLKNLKSLILFGNRVEPSVIADLKKANPSLLVNYQ